MTSPKKSSKRRRNLDIEGSPEAKKAKDSSSEDNSSSTNEVVPTAGRVKRLVLRNIMCHDTMQIDFNPNVNFIIGQNGSGKSSVLNALTVGLGGKAKATDRANNVGDIMKNGCTKSSIETTLTNVGPMAYKPDLYGDEIKITRIMTKSSQGDMSSIYKLCSSSGRLISSKKKELTQILTCMNIQPENPISIMNQYASQTFLKGSSDTTRYDLFMKATQLEVTGANYKEALINSEDTQKRLKETEQQLSKEKKEIDALRSKIDKLKSLDQLKAEIESMQVELKWASVSEQEAVLNNAKEELQKYQQILEERESAQQHEDKKIEDIDTKLENLKAELNNIDDDSESSRDKYNEVKSQYQTKRGDLETKKRDLRNCQVRMRNNEENIKALIAEVKKIESGNSQAEQERAQQKENLIKYKQELEQVEALLKTNHNTLQHLEASKQHIEKDEHSLKMQLEKKSADCTKTMNRLNGLKQQPSMDTSIAIFGRNMPRLIKRIEEEYAKRNFIKKPVGPIGSFIKVKDCSWIPAIESVLGDGFLRGFCVDNGRDSKVLNTIMREIFHDEPLPPTFCSKFHDKVHDVRNSCTGTDRHPNLFHSMEISNPVVANCIIDNKEAEFILLIPTSAEAAEIMKTAANVPRNCRRAITQKGDTFFPDPRYKTYGGKVGKPKLLQVSSRDVILALQDEFSTLEREKLQVYDAYKEIRQKLEENMREYLKIERDLRKLASQRNKLKHDIEHLSDKISDEHTDNCAIHKDEITTLKQRNEHEKVEEIRLTEEIVKLEEEVKISGAELAKYRAKLSNRDEKITLLNREIQKLKNERSEIINNSNHLKKKAQRARDEIHTVVQTVRNQEEVVHKAIEEAEAAGPRVRTNRTIPQIRSECQAHYRKIQYTEQQFGSKEELEQQLDEKLEKNKSVLDYYEKIQRVNEQQLVRVEERRNEFNELKRITGQRIKKEFSDILALRQYDGSITIDHASKKLILEVIPRSSQRKEVNNVQTLSGGERSFSTIAFVMALWECTTFPIYFVDEFDVCMDKVNRRIAIDILLNLTKRHPEKQFGFLTPLDASLVKPCSTITVLRMSAPERTGDQRSQSSQN
ncbi:structural maintenance of chromosomes protein 6 [Chelonus insularis]|uniref:structural maintenance of chromosomes protein 6 n=1 Tax=Chelonus insularis TaxID=460826 RepID=UPI001589548E|nr:structural maintenance of chromosomes protein 6 [Chelonus insularis]